MKRQFDLNAYGSKREMREIYGGRKFWGFETEMYGCTNGYDIGTYYVLGIPVKKHYKRACRH